MIDALKLLIKDLTRCAKENEKDARQGQPYDGSEARVIAAEQRRVIKLLNELRRKGMKNV